MTCYNNCYLPIPPRAWSRVQNSCSLTTDTEDEEFVKLPYSGKIVSSSLLGESMAMLNKGNVLQYKANSSNLTKSQKYSKIAQGKWTNRNTTWATQNSRGYTNPNTTSLKRSGNVNNIAIDPITGTIIGPTQAPVTCLKPITVINEGLPSNESGGSGEPQIPPPVPPSPASDTFPSIIPDTPDEPIVIQDEGILICSVQENICTGETKRTQSQQLCNPTSDSDVPGTIQLLCWNDGTPTWYPRQRYIMSNSGNKWPVNAVLFSSVRPYAPTIISVTYNLNFNVLTWVQTQNCLPISKYDIFQNEILVKSVSGDVYTTDIEVSYCGSYTYFIIAVTNGSNISSEESNKVSINRYASTPPEEANVNWASANFYDTFMDINMTFKPPSSILCGTPDYFVVNVYNSTSTLIATQNISYILGELVYTVNFNDIDYSTSGNVVVYLVTIDDNTGQKYNGDSVSCNYISSDLPIYLNTQINTDRTELSFNVISQSYLHKVAGLMCPNSTTQQLLYYYWDTNPIISDNLSITINKLVNDEYEYFIIMKSKYFELTNFTDPVGIVASNQKGIQRNIV